MKVFLPDGTFKEFDKTPSILEVAHSISPRLGEAALAGELSWGDVDNPPPQGVLFNQLQDVRTPVPHGAQLRIVTQRDPEALEVIRHSAAHLMAQAVQDIWPKVQVTIGPVIEQGFYYDFYSPMNFQPEHLAQIEERIQSLLATPVPLVREMWSHAKAVEYFTKKGELFKVEIIKDLNLPEVSIYRQGDWLDLCRGPHVQHTGQIGVVKLLNVAGAFWRADETQAPLQRIYGTAFFDKKSLKKHLAQREQAKKRDHRLLGKQLQLFYFHPYSPGGAFFTPKGSTVYRELVNMVRDFYKKHNYEEVMTPQVFSTELYERSGHMQNFKDNMYFVGEQHDEAQASTTSATQEASMSLKPMNCPGHCLLYKMQKRSYRALPWRVAEFGRLHRAERSGVLHGLTRVRAFCQDDAHVFCRVNQMQSEIEDFMRMLDDMYRLLGMPEYKVVLSTRPEQRMGSDVLWDRAEQALQQALMTLNVEHKIEPGEGAFYGPKIDIMVTDALSRSWQLGTLQCDFNMPESFVLQYVGEDNALHMPVLLHRAVLGSLERFLGVYLEHTGGKLPFWLAPVQLRLLPISDVFLAYAQKLAVQFGHKGLRVEVDDRTESLGFKIREAQLEKVPAVAILGQKEQDQNAVSLRGLDASNFNMLDVEHVAGVLERSNKERRLGALGELI